MLGLHLIHLGFLAAGLAVAVPVLIHLLFRQKTRTVPIGSVRFLQQVVREHRRRRRVRQWLLLALRMLAVLLLAALFARPYWDESQRRGLEQEVVFLVDRSASMQAKGSQSQSTFEQAVDRVKSEIKLLDDNVIVHVALCDASGVQEVPLEKLASATASEAATDFGLALAWVRDVLNASARSKRRIVLVSDLQRTGLPRARMERLPDGIELQIHDIGDALPRNVSVDSVEALRTEIRPDSQVTVRGLVRNHGPLPIRKLGVTCEFDQAVDGKQADGTGNVPATLKQVDIAGLGTAVVEFPLPIKKDGLYRGHVRIDSPDSLQLDNCRWFAFEARHPDRVLLVDGQTGRSSFSNETYFLETALRLQTEEMSGRMRSFEAERMEWESGEGFPRLDGYRAVVLTNVRRLSETDGTRLDKFVRSGGSLLIFAGDQVTSESVAPLQKHGLLPGVVASNPVEGRLRVDQWDAKHLALACFTDPQQGDLRRIEFRKVLTLTSPVEKSRILLRTGEHIVAAEMQVEKGRCIYFGSTADRDWTELPRTPMYVPLVRQLLAYLTDQLTERSAVTARLVQKSDERSGIKEMEGEPGRWLVINLDPRESALDRVAADDVLKVAGVAKSKPSQESLTAALGVKLPPDSLRPDEIWTTVAWILLIVLAAETLLAGRVHA